VILKNMLLNPTRVEAYEVLKRMGAKVEYIQKSNDYDSIGDIVVEYAPLSGVVVKFKSATVDSFGDHRIAMSFAIAGLKTPMNITDTECIQTSFPNFIQLLSDIAKVENEN